MQVLLVEDDLKLAEFIVKGLKEAGFEVDHAGNGPEGLDLALRSTYELCIFDIMLPGMDGISLIGEIRRRNIPCPILLLSAKSGVDVRVEGLQAGGDDYLVKPFAFTELLARTHALIRRARGFGETTRLEIADLSVDVLTRDVRRSGERIDLQNREFELLTFMLRNQGRVISKTMIIENVWNFNFDPHTNIVEARMSKLREKMDKGFSKKLIHTIRGAGYVLREEE